MFEKNLEIGYLLDFYGDILPERRRDILDLYYNDDLSLSEIAEDEGISRQGVRHIIKKGEEELLRLETALGLCEHYSNLQEVATSLSHFIDVLNEDGSPKAKEWTTILDNAVQTILNKGV